MSVIVFHVSATLVLLCPPPHQKQSRSFDLTVECASHDQTTEDHDRLDA